MQCVERIAGSHASILADGKYLKIEVVGLEVAAAHKKADAASTTKACIGVSDHGGRPRLL
jgi:hypothetical protein